MPRQLHGPQGGFRHQPQGPLRAGQQPRQVQAAAVEQIGQVVAAAAARAVGLVLLDQRFAAGKDVGRPQDQLAFVGRALVDAVDGDRLAADLQDLAVGQHDLEREHVLPRGAVFEAAASRGIDADHAADGGDRAGGRIGAKIRPRSRRWAFKRS